jgi:hypothetical protein
MSGLKAEPMAAIFMATVAGIFGMAGIVSRTSKR